MLFYNLIFDIFISYFYVKNNLSFENNLKVKIFLIIIILINSFNLIFILSEQNLYEGFIFYFNQESLIKYINPKEVLFFSKIALFNIFFIVTLILILKIFKKKFNFILNINISLKILILVIFLFNPLIIQQLLNSLHSNSYNIEKLKNEIQILQNYSNDNLNKKQVNKNLVFLIAESLNYDIATDKKLMPYLSMLGENGKIFSDINELKITNFTTSGMYALLCGNFLPIYDISKEQLCLTHILKDNDYDVTFLRGDSNHFLDQAAENGKIDYGKNIINICDKDCLLNKYDLENFHVWGAHDNITINETIEILKNKINKKKNFAIFSKTVDSHVEGYVSNQCKINDNFKSNIERVFSCLDNEIKTLVSNVNNLDVNNGTIIVIASDHLLMNQAFINKKKYKNKQKNFFLIYDNSNQNFQMNNKTATKIDIPATILDYMGLGDKVGIGVSIFSNKENLFNKINYINKIKFNNNEYNFNLRELIKSKLKIYLPNSTYIKIKNIFQTSRQKIALLKYKYYYNLSFNNIIDPKNYDLIAHAGGEIDNFSYTNSLEAINLSYKKGFKFIELDILETSDGHLVAAHDWESWANISGFNKKIPPSLKEFKEHKIYEKYTPLTIYDLERWFKNRPETTLVTDKIDKPSKFLKVYNLKEQLIMELFSEKSIKEANKLDIQFFVSDIFLYKNLPLNRNLSEKLINLKNLRGITASNIVISKHLNFFIEAFNDLGIGIYFYQISEKNYLKEDQIRFLCDFSNLLLGGYIETIDFKKEIKCSEN